MTDSAVAGGVRSQVCNPYPPCPLCPPPLQPPSHPAPLAVPTPQTPAQGPALGLALGPAPALLPAPALRRRPGRQTLVSEEGEVVARGSGSGGPLTRSSSGLGHLRQRSRGVHLKASATCPTDLQWQVIILQSRRSIMRSSDTCSSVLASCLRTSDVVGLQLS